MMKPPLKEVLDFFAMLAENREIEEVGHGAGWSMLKILDGFLHVPYIQMGKKNDIHLVISLAQAKYIDAHDSVLRDDKYKHFQEMLDVFETEHARVQKLLGKNQGCGEPLPLRVSLFRSCYPSRHPIAAERLPKAPSCQFS